MKDETACRASHTTWNIRERTSRNSSLACLSHEMTSRSPHRAWRSLSSDDFGRHRSALASRRSPNDFSIAAERLSMQGEDHGRPSLDSDRSSRVRELHDLRRKRKWKSHSRTAFESKRSCGKTMRSARSCSRPCDDSSMPSHDYERACRDSERSCVARNRSSPRSAGPSSQTARASRSRRALVSVAWRCEPS
jgi:hypothetical protein